MNTLTQAPTGNTIAQQAKAIAKAPKAKPATDKAPAPATAWHSAWVHDGWQVDVSGPRPTHDQLDVAAALVRGFGGHTGCETMHIAMCLRPQGCTVSQFTNTQRFARPVSAGPVGPANNKRNKLTDRATGGKRGLGWCAVTELSGTSEARGKAFHLRLTPAGAAIAKAAGIKADVITRLSKAPDMPKAPKAVKTDKPAKAPGKPKGEVDKVGATTLAATPGNATSEAPKPTVTVPAADKPVSPGPGAVHRGSVGNFGPLKA